MARKDDYRDVKRFCTMCTNSIPADRPWNAVTCSKECSKRRIDYRRSRIDQTVCRYCQRPSTPEERTRYVRWRKWEKDGQDEEQTNAKLLAENVRLKRKVSDPLRAEMDDHALTQRQLREAQAEIRSLIAKLRAENRENDKVRNKVEMLEVELSEEHAE